MTTDPPDLGKGLFGYRKSAVNQILADRDVMLRQAEGRVRAAESKVAELQNELTSMKDRNTRMDDQVERLRAQLEILMTNAQTTPAAAAPSVPVVAQAAPAAHAPEEVPAPQVMDPSAAWEAGSAAWESQYSQPDSGGAPFGGDGPSGPYDEYGESVASFEGLDQEPAPYSEAHDDMPMVLEDGDELFGPHDSAHVFGREVNEESSATDFDYQTTAPEEGQGPRAWADSMPPAPEPMRKVDEMRYQPDDDSQNLPPTPIGEEEAFPSMSYGFSLHPAQPEDTGRDDTQQPVFRGFTDDSFDEPNPSEYIGQPVVSDTPSQVTPPAPDWASPSQPWTEPSEPAPVWPAPEPAPRSPREWEPTTPQPSQEWPQAPSAQASAPPEPHPAGESRGGVSSQASDIPNRFLTEELKGILSAAEESAARILERARVTSEHQIAQSNRLWREVQAELARFSEWRQQVEPIIRSVHAKVEGVRTQIEDVPEKIRQALAPMADSISMIDSDLAELASASTPPLLLTPSGLDPGSPVNDWPIGEDGPSTGSEGHTEGNAGAGHIAG